MEKLKKFISVLVIISIVLGVNVGACSRAKEYVPDYTTASKRDLMVYTLGESTARYVYGVNGERISAELEHAQGTKKGESGENIATDIATTLGKIYYRMSHAGSTLYATDEKGEVLYHTEYDPWGNPQGKTKVNINFSGIENFNNFTGYTYDETLGIYYAQARFYNPEIKRFTSEDPIKDGLNWYAYVGNNPVNSVDILGLAVISLSEWNKDIDELYVLADKYINENYSVGSIPGFSLKHDDLVLDFIRYRVYGGNGALDEAKWTLTAGAVDKKFINFVQSKDARLYNRYYSTEEVLLYLGNDKKNTVNIKHMVATFQGQYHIVDSIRQASGLLGDMVSGVKSIEDLYAKDYRDKFKSTADFYFNFLGCDKTTISHNDILADVDAVNICAYKKSTNKTDLHAMSSYYSSQYVEYRFTYYYSNVTGENFNKLKTKAISLNVGILDNHLYAKLQRNFATPIIHKTTDEQNKAMANATARYIIREAQNEIF